MNLIGPPKPGYHWQYQMGKDGHWFYGHARNLDLTPYPGIIAILEDVPTEPKPIRYSASQRRRGMRNEEEFWA